MYKVSKIQSNPRRLKVAETTENTETTPKTENAEERAKNFWAYWRNAPTVLKAFAITLLVITTLAILGNITEGPGTTYVVSDQSGTGVVSEGPVGSKQNNLKDLYYEVLGKAGDYQRSKKLFDSCQVQYPPAKYKDVCGGKSHAYAKEKLA